MKAQAKKAALANHQVFAVAVQAECDPKSVRRFVRGLPMRPLTAQRIRRAFAVLGIPTDVVQVAK